MPMKKGTVRKPLRDRFDEKWTLDEAGCWIWQAFQDKAGYARIQEGGRSGAVLYAHRYSYEQYKGLIPTGLELDHLCRVRHCVNPDHLEAVPHRVNVARGNSPTMLLHLSGRCKRGHKATEENTYRYKATGMIAYCRPCRGIRRKEARYAETNKRVQ